MSGSQADTSWFRVRHSFGGFLLSADLRLFEVLDATASCFKTEAVWCQTSSACCAATCLWMLVGPVNSCWQHFHHISLHLWDGAGTSLVLTKRANACKYISNCHCEITLGLRLMEASVKFLLLPFHRSFQFVSYYSVEEHGRVTVLLVSFPSAGSDQESQIAAALLPVSSPHDLVSWVSSHTLGGERNPAHLSRIYTPPLTFQSHTLPMLLLCLHWIKITGNGADRPYFEHGNSLLSHCPSTPWRTTLMSHFRSTCISYTHDPETSTATLPFSLQMNISSLYWHLALL